MMKARAAVKISGKAEIMGVAFFDFFHNQDGVAPNAIELHPVLSFRCLAAAAAPAGAGRAKATPPETGSFIETVRPVLPGRLPQPCGVGL